MTKGTLAVKRIYKDSVFRMLFREKEELLSLYNAIYDTEYTDTEQMEITTLENAIYMGYKNDLSCIIDYHLALLEHQSTVNPNMPLRYLMYISDLYGKITAESDIFSRRRIALPAPSFVVLYNGVEKQPERKIMLLSDAYGAERNHSWQKDEISPNIHSYVTSGKETALELRVIQLNINAGYNQEMMAKCPTLDGYVQLVSYIREYQKSMPIAEAVDRAVKQCIHEGILEKFLREHRAEVTKMSIYEYDEEKHFRTLREEGREEGIRQERERTYYRMFRNQKTPKEVSEFTGEPEEYVHQIYEKYLETVCEEDRYSIKTEKEGESRQ